MHRLHYLGVSIVALVAIGGTCSDPPPYRDVSGIWANATWGPGAVMTSGAGEALDIDIAMDLRAAVPQKRGSVPVTGSVCIRDPKLGLSGTNEIDAATSTWTGSDYGGTRLDLAARAADGRSLDIKQAFMHNSSPDKLGDAIVELKPAGEGPKATFSFEGFARRADVTCP
jgi:hypothetical protein